jgi:hypothetical protein
MRSTGTRVFIFCLLAALLLPPALFAADGTSSPSNPVADWLTAVVNFLTVQVDHVLSLPQG